MPSPARFPRLGRVSGVKETVSVGGGVMVRVTVKVVSEVSVEDNDIEPETGFFRLTV